MKYKADAEKSNKLPRCFKIARKCQKERKAEAMSTENTNMSSGSMNTKSPKHQSRQRLETVNGEKNKIASLLKTKHCRLPCNAGQLCNEEDTTLLWPILGVNSKGEKGQGSLMSVGQALYHL